MKLRSGHLSLVGLVALLPSAASADRVSEGRAAAAVVAPMPPRQPPPPPPRPSVPDDVAKHGKLIAGSYTCKGNSPTPSGASQPLEAVLVVKLDLDNAWINSSWVSKASKIADYRTFDGVAHQWTRFQVRNDGSHAVLTSLGEKGGEWVWEGPSTSQSGTVQQREHEQWVGKELKLWGEAQLGGAWQKTYQVSCKR